MSFADVEDIDVLRSLHDHLFQRHALIDRVIRARKLHHSRFFSLQLDRYGRNGTTTTTLRALASAT